MWEPMGEGGGRCAWLVNLLLGGGGERVGEDPGGLRSRVTGYSETYPLIDVTRFNCQTDFHKTHKYM
jgi:hypothetical protein